MKVDFDISGWSPTQSYKKFDVVFFSGHSVTGCNPFESGYYYATADNSSASNTSLSPTGTNTKWTRSFPSTPSYNSSVSFSAENNKHTFGDGYYTLLPKSHNNLKVKYNLSFQGRTTKEAKAILHFLGHRFEEGYTGAASGTAGAYPNLHTEYQGDLTLTGFNFTPFRPYNQTGKYYCEEFDHNQVFTNVHNISALFDKSEDSLTNWKNKEINLDNTSGFWAAGATYGTYDIVYFSGHNVSNFSGFYYHTGKGSGIATAANGPTGASTLWTNDTFYFKPTSFNIPQKPRLLKSELNRNYVERWNDGINTNLLDINLEFQGKSEHEAKAISHFLINKKGYESFKFSPPHPYEQANKIFVCQGWSDSYVFNDNRSLSAAFEEMPLDLNKTPRNFRTFILDEGGRVIAPYEKQIGTAGSVFEVDYGIFMTGFKSGTGMYLYNSGDQKIISTLNLSGEHARSGVYKFKDNTDSRFKLNSHASAIFELGQKESGFFEIEFATTGKSGAQNSWFTDDLSTEGYFYYFSGHGGAGYTGPHNRPSQLTVTSTDQYNFPDPSGTIKIDLTGNAEAVPPGPIASFDVKANEDDILLTGQWTYSEPLTATGILLEVSGVAPASSLPAGETATGVLIDEPTGTTVFSYPCVPGQAHHFRIRTQNIDLIGGNVNGGNLRKVEATEFVHASATVTKTSLTVRVDKESAKSFAESNIGFKNVNLKTIAQNEINRLNALNSNITVDVFSKIEFKFDEEMYIFSANTNLPALDTGTKFTSTYGGGAGLDPVPIELYIPKTTQIIGAGGKGANAFSVRSYGGAIGDKKECPIAYTVTSSQRSTLSSKEVRFCSLPELAGVGPISLRYLKGKMDGNYSVGSTPNDGENGGTAFEISSDYASSSIRLECKGFIGGGGGGGGAGGTRVSNITALQIPREIITFDPNTKTLSAKDRKVMEYLLPYKSDLKTHHLAFTKPHPALQQKIVPATPDKDDPKDNKQDQFYYEVRPGGGGGGGAGFNLSTSEGGDAGIISPSPADGGKGCAQFVSKIRAFSSRTFEVLTSSKNGESSEITFPLSTGEKIGEARGGNGATSMFLAAPIMGRGNYALQNPSGLKVSFPDEQESLRNAGGYGGFGGSFGQDGFNGEHPVQNYTERYISSTYGPEPRSFGFGGTGGLCINTNGAILDFYPTDNIPCSGQDGKHELEAKNSELYRNKIGYGSYLTPKFTSATAIATASGQNKVVGLISGLKSNGSDKMDFTSVTRTTPNQSNAVNGSYPAWKAFNQEINGSFNDYVLMDQGTFPYYLVYDFGNGNAQQAECYHIASAGASESHYASNSTESVFGTVFAPTRWQLYGYNGAPDGLNGDSDMTLLHTKVHHNFMPKARIVSPNSKVYDADYTENKEQQKSLIEVEGSLHNSYVSVPGAIRYFQIPEENKGSFRYYILKILDADGSADGDAVQKVKIADFGLRGKNESYAGFIKLI